MGKKAGRRSNRSSFTQEEEISKAKRRRRRGRQFLDGGIQQSVTEVACDTLAASVGGFCNEDEDTQGAVIARLNLRRS